MSDTTVKDAIKTVNLEDSFYSNDEYIDAEIEVYSIFKPNRFDPNVYLNANNEVCDKSECDHVIDKQMMSFALVNNGKVGKKQMAIIATDSVNGMRDNFGSGVRANAILTAFEYKEDSTKMNKKKGDIGHNFMKITVDVTDSLDYKMQLAAKYGTTIHL